MPTQMVKKSLVLAPPERVWAALTDPDQLATWFGAEFGAPFVAGARVVGRMVPTQVLPSAARRRKAYTGLPLALELECLEPPQRMTFRWSSLTFFDPAVQAEAATSRATVEIEPDPRGSRLTITEGEFDGLAGEHLEKAIERSAAGWSGLVLQLELFLSGALDLRPRKD